MQSRLHKIAREIRVTDGVGRIPLPGGLVALIDADDLPIAEGWRWSAKRGVGGHVYAYRNAWEPEARKQRSLLLHRAIMEPPTGMVVDHINGDTLDNRRANLRICTQGQNLRNSYYHRDPAASRRGPTGTTGHRGVYRHSDGSFVARMMVDGRQIDIQRGSDVDALAETRQWCAAILASAPPSEPALIAAKAREVASNRAISSGAALALIRHVLGL